MVTTPKSDADDLVTSARLHPRHAKQRKMAATTPTDSPVIPIRVESSMPHTPPVVMNNAANLKPMTEFVNPAVTPSSLEPSPTTAPIVKPINPMNDSSTPSTRAHDPVLQSPNTPGSSRNPILLTEGPPKRDLTGKDSKPVPHVFQDRHSKLYTWRAPPISSWAPKPADGSIFTGHTGEDMYRMRKAKMASQSQQGVPPHTAPLMKYQMAARQPMAAQQQMVLQQQSVLQQQRALQQQRIFQQQRTVPAIQHFAPPPMRHSLYTPRPFSGQQTETQTQELQHIREHSGSTLRKRKMSGYRDQESEPEPGCIDQDTAMAPHISNSQQTASENAKEVRPIPILPDVQLQLASIIERASLITSLLRMYPQSADPKTSRREIAMLAYVQHQYLVNWLKSEDRQTRKLPVPHTPHPGRRTGSPSAKPVERDRSSGTMAEAESRRRHDDKMRQLLSADAEHWQDGSGLSVADVHAKTGMASPSEDGDGADKEGTEATIASSTGYVLSARGQAESEPPSPGQPKLPSAKDI